MERLFVPKGDATSVARRLNELIEDETLRRTMAGRSRAFSKENFYERTVCRPMIQSILRLA